MVKGRYVDLSGGLTGHVKGQLILDLGGIDFVDHRNQNSMKKGHRKRCYEFPETVTLSFYRSTSVGSNEGDDPDDTISYEFPATSRIYKLGDGDYEVVHINKVWSIVIRFVRGVFVLGDVHGFTLSESGPVAQPNHFSTGKRPRAPGHL